MSGVVTGGEAPQGPLARPVIAPRDSVAEMEGYYSPQLEVDVRLNTNEAPESPPPGYLAAVTEELATIELNRYPDRVAMALREAIGRLHGLGAERIYPANGSNEVLQSLLLAYGGPGRSALVFEPTYAMHSQIARVTGTALRTGRRGPDYLVTPEELRRALREARDEGNGPELVFLCSPNNPTGRVEPREVLEELLETAPGLVVVDEAYGQFAPHSALELIDEYPSLVVVRTFSKTWSLAALRLGYAVGAPEVVDAMFSVSLPYHLDALKQAAGRIALDYVDEMHARVERLVSERERLLGALSALGLEVCPSEANFILFRVPGRSAATLWQGFVERSILVRNVSSYAGLEDFLRVTVGLPDENDAFLATLEALVST